MHLETFALLPRGSPTGKATGELYNMNNFPQAKEISGLEDDPVDKVLVPQV